MKKFKEKQQVRDKLYLIHLILISIVLLGNSCKREISKDNESFSSLKRENSKVFELHEQNAKSKEDIVIYADINKDTVLTYRVYNNRVEDNDCKGWVSTPKGILGISNRLHEISSFEWNQCYGSLNCGVKGILVKDGVIYNYDLNAGGWLHLSSNEKEMYLGAKAITESSQFISINYCDEEWD